MAGMKKGPAYGKRDYTPVSWDHYFQRVVDVKVDADVSFYLFDFISLIMNLGDCVDLLYCM